MYDHLSKLFFRSRRVDRRRKACRRQKFSFETTLGRELEPRRLLAVAPLPISTAGTRNSAAAYVSTMSFKAAAPTNLIASPKNQAADLTWTAPSNTGGSPINDYVVRYSVANTFNWKTIYTGNTMTRATVPNLVNGTSYVFQVAAVNSTGIGGFTSPSAPITPPGYAIAPNTPVNLSAQPGDGQVSLAWGRPSWDGGAPISDYVLQYRAAGSLNWTAVSRSPSIATIATIPGLANGTSYSFRVAAVNSRGTSGFSSTALATPASTPLAPTRLLAEPGNGTIRLAWSAPASDGGRPISDYQVIASVDGGQTWAPVQRPASASTQAELRGLTNGTAYSFKVAAVNQMGAGAFSNPVGPVTPAATVPGTPTGVGPTIGDGAITIRWNAPTDDGGSAVVGYALQYSSNGGASWAAVGDTPIPGTSFTVMGLTNGIGYAFRVAAVNEIGRGTFSVPTLPVAPATVPGIPGPVTAAAGNASVLLSWIAPSVDGGSSVTDYAVQYSSNGGASWILYPHAPSTGTTIAVNGLTNGVEHIFRVAAVNVIGAGGYSLISAAVVPLAPVTVPSAPTALSVQAGNGQATLTWSEPASNGNSVITSYEVSFSSDGRRTWSAPLSVPATSRTATVTNLTNGISYSVQVVAVNLAGRGAEAAVTTTPTNPAATATVQFLKSGTLPVTVQFGYTIRDANGFAQAKFLRVEIGSTQRIASITVPDFDRIQGSVSVTITVRNLPRGTTKTQSFTLQKKTNYSMGITYNTQVTDPWAATTIRCG